MTLLHHMVVRGDESTPDKLCVLVHGILGAGMNLRTVARRIQREHPDYWFLLPDLRGHGGSPAMDPPHGVEACARDILALEDSFGVRSTIRIGHSFGGKVVLAAKELSPAATLVMDTIPGAAGDDDPGRQWMEGLLTQLARVPIPLASRQDLSVHLGSYGGSASFEGWMGTNLRSDGNGGFEWRFKLPIIRKLIHDYWEMELHPSLHSPGETHLLYGDQSERFDSTALASLEESLGPRLHCIENAGHWLHVDNPTGTVEVLSEVIGKVKKK